MSAIQRSEVEQLLGLVFFGASLTSRRCVQEEWMDCVRHGYFEVDPVTVDGDPEAASQVSNCMPPVTAAAAAAPATAL